MKAEQDSVKNVVHEAEVEIKNADGLHMRPAMQFVDIANRYKSEVVVSTHLVTTKRRADSLARLALPGKETL